MQEENERLKKMLASGGKVDPSLNTFGTDEALKKQLAENDKAMRDMKLSYEEKLAEAAKSQVRDSFFKILNLDMTENFVYFVCYLRVVRKEELYYRRLKPRHI